MDRLEGDVLGLWNTVATDTKTGVGKAVSFVEGLPRDVVRLFAQADTWLVDAGEQLIAGLLKGVTHGVTHLLGDIPSIGGKIIGGIGHALGFGSPSTLTMPHGASLVEGVQVGMHEQLPALISDVDKISRSVISEFAKVGGRDAGHQFMVDFAGSITGNAGLVEFALSSVLKDLTKSSTLRQAFASAMSGVTPAGHPVGPGGSLSNQFDVHDNVFQVQDPRDMGRKLAVIARRKNAVRT